MSYQSPHLKERKAKWFIPRSERDIAAGSLMASLAAATFLFGLMVGIMYCTAVSFFGLMLGSM